MNMTKKQADYVRAMGFTHTTVHLADTDGKLITGRGGRQLSTKPMYVYRSKLYTPLRGKLYEVKDSVLAKDVAKGISRGEGDRVAVINRNANGLVLADGTMGGERDARRSLCKRVTAEVIGKTAKTKATKTKSTSTGTLTKAQLKAQLKSLTKDELVAMLTA